MSTQCRNDAPKIAGAAGDKCRLLRTHLGRCFWGANLLVANKVDIKWQVVTSLIEKSSGIAGGSSTAFIYRWPRALMQLEEENILTTTRVTASSFSCENVTVVWRPIALHSIQQSDCNFFSTNWMRVSQIIGVLRTVPNTHTHTLSTAMLWSEK